MVALSLAERPAVLAELRSRIAAPRGMPNRLQAEIPALEAWLGGWPRPGISEIVGAPGSGRLSLLLPSLVALTRQGRSVVVIDAMEQVYPPGWAHPFGVAPGVEARGVDLAQLWLVRPGLDRAAWAAEQVARSGSVEAVVLLDAPRLGRAGVRLARAAESGGTALFVIAEVAEAELPAALRLSVVGYASGAAGSSSGAVRVRCSRARDGRAVGERVIAVAADGRAGPKLNATGAIFGR